jgi:hypothetical protein
MMKEKVSDCRRVHVWSEAAIVRERKIKPILLYLLSGIACIVLAACTKPVQTGVNDSPTPSPKESNSTAASDEQPKPETTRATTPPTLSEAQGAVERVYRQALMPDKNNPNSFVVGDFNGDGSEDIAIIVAPARGKLAEINSEFANWIIIDPKKVVLPDPKKAVQPAPAETGPVKIEQRDSLLAIIHGYGPDGWRNPQAKQTYLLRNVVGEEMRVVPLKDFPGALKVMANGVKSRADIISEKLAGVAGFLYWTAGKYVWHEE